MAVAAAALSLFAIHRAGSVLSAPARREIPPPPTGFESVSFRGADGIVLRGWLRDTDPSLPAVMLLHAIRGSRVGMIERARFLAEAGYGALLFDSRAHGESGGARISFGHLESEDARAAVDLLRRENPNRSVGAIGVSLGGAAMLLADPPLGVNALVAEAVYPDIRGAVANRLEIHYGAFARWLSPLLLWQLWPRIGVAPDALRPLASIPDLGAPVLVVVGAEDRRTTPGESRELFDAAREPKAFWIVDGAGHEDLHRAARREYEARVLDFFDDALGRPGR